MLYFLAGIYNFTKNWLLKVSTGLTNIPEVKANTIPNE